MSIILNKNKSIGKVLYIVEGSRTERYLLHKIFCKIFDYQFEAITRDHPYRIYNSKDNPYSKVFVINAEESNIKYIAKDNEFLNNLFIELIENYSFDVNNSAIFYLFDRDGKSNTDAEFIRNLLTVMTNSRDNENNYRQGLLLLSYPSIESFTLSCFDKNSFLTKVTLGNDLKQYLNYNKIDQSKIGSTQLLNAAYSLIDSLNKITGNDNIDIDDFKRTNIAAFEFEENIFDKEQVYNCLSLLTVSLLDLGLIEIQEE